jgi:chemotaxis protein CheD
MPNPAERIIGISEMAVSMDPFETLVTYSLGSCVGLALFDPVAGVGGLLHAMMPVSTLDPAKAAANPHMFTDTGVAALLQALFDLGATRRDLVATVAGAAAQAPGSSMFRIGERNYVVLRRVLWKNRILIAAEDVGGSISRTMFLEMGTGRTLIRANGSKHELHSVIGGRARCR